MQLSRSFSLQELLESPTARRKGYTEQFNPYKEVVTNLANLCTNVLQPLRDAIKHPIQVTSGYRCDRVNKAVKGSSTSDHKFGKAADIQLWIDGENKNQLLFDMIVKLNLPFKQLIDEFGSESAPAWIHVSYDMANIKKEKLRARSINGKTVYSKIP